jgi:hypothetical protein
MYVHARVMKGQCTYFEMLASTEYPLRAQGCPPVGQQFAHKVALPHYDNSGTLVWR